MNLRECEYTGAAVLTRPLRPHTVPSEVRVLSLLKRELLQLLEGDEEDDVPGAQSQPVGPESLIESEEALVPPRLHQPVQSPFVHRASRQNSLVHHSRPDHVYGVGRQRPRQAAREAGNEMCQNGVSHEAGAEEVLLRYVIDRKFDPDHDSCSLRCGDDASPQAAGALRLVDVDEVGHHAALKQTALRLHPDLEDVGGVCQRRGQDSRHDPTEDVDDHRLIFRSTDEQPLQRVVCSDLDCPVRRLSQQSGRNPRIKRPDALFLADPEEGVKHASVSHLRVLRLTLDLQPGLRQVDGKRAKFCDNRGHPSVDERLPVQVHHLCGGGGGLHLLQPRQTHQQAAHTQVDAVLWCR